MFILMAQDIPLEYYKKFQYYVQFLINVFSHI
jgi:hypothetical protein